MPKKRLSDYHAKLRIKKGMQVRREEFLDYMTFEENHRPLFTEIFGPMVGLKDEWKEQGASPEELDMSAFKYRRHALGGVPVSTGYIGGPGEEILEETDEYVIARDARGRTVKLFLQSATLPLPLDYPVADMDDWLQVKPHYEFSEERFGEDWEAVARQHLQEGRVVRVSIPGGFDEPRQLLGEEGLCIAYYEQPELVHDILKTIGDTAIKVLDRVSSRVQVDALMVHEDMAGKSGSLAGPKQIEEFIRPYYRRVWDMLADRGARVFGQDSDGNLNGVVDAFIDAGVNWMYPCEPAAGMDIVKLREEHGARLAFMGGLDKHVIRQSEEAIVAELEYKIPPLVATGGCVLGLDHRIPNGTPLENYRFYIQKAWEIMEREAAKL
ncbi:MAG: uroporphyrinogen decarboxylase family protein [Armatimonadota bacterium]